MNAWGMTDVGRVRENNEDAFQIELEPKSDAALCVVCDGMGGAKAGNIASQMATEVFMAKMKAGDFAALDGKALARLMSEAVECANRAIHERAQNDKNYSGMGTTLVAAALCGQTATILNVGDSRAYHIDQNGISRVTRDHSLVEDMLQLGEITELEAREHPNKNLITRAVGTDPSISGDLYTIDLQKGDFLLLCSDGLSNLVSEQEMLYEVLYGGDAASAAARLCEIANTRGGFDNITVVLMTR